MMRAGHDDTNSGFSVKSGFIDGFGLKMTAVLSMLTDHTGAVLFPDMLWLRMIGRIAFPIYCYLLIEGYRYTKSIKKYLFRLGAFALISEVPFNLAFSGTVTDPSSVNVFFTLFLGLAAVWTCDYIKSSAGSYGLLGYGSFIIAGIIAGYLHTDYRYYGIALIFVFYEFGNRQRTSLRYRVLTVVLSGLIFASVADIEIYALTAFIPILCYNGKRGFNHKAVSLGFYVFYPLHLVILWWLSLGLP